MKTFILIFTISAFSITILSFSSNENSSVITNPGNGATFTIPTDVQAIIDNSCYGCHNSESSSTKGKMKLNFDKLPTMKVSKQVGKLIKISKSVNKDKMPTEKFLNKYPDRALTEDDVTKITSWADGLANELSGE